MTIDNELMWAAGTSQFDRAYRSTPTRSAKEYFFNIGRYAKGCASDIERFRFPAYFEMRTSGDDAAPLECVTTGRFVFHLFRKSWAN